MKRLLATFLIALCPIVSASADPPVAARPAQEAPVPAAADILGYATEKWGSPIFEMAHPVLMIPPHPLPIGLAEAKLSDKGIYTSSAKFAWLLVSNGDGMLSSVVTFLNDRNYDEAYRAVIAKLGRGTMGSLSVTAAAQGRCMFWRAEGHSITMHFTASAGTVLIVTPDEVVACAAGVPKTAEKTAIEQGV